MKKRLLVLGVTLTLALAGVACEGEDDEEEGDFAAPAAVQQL